MRAHIARRRAIMFRAFCAAGSRVPLTSALATMGRFLIEAEVPVNVKSGDVIMCGETELVLTVTKL